MSVRASLPAALAEKLREVEHVQRLSGHFDEYAFFPFLEDLGLRPLGSSSAAARPDLTSLTWLHGLRAFHRPRRCFVL